MLHPGIKIPNLTFGYNLKLKNEYKSKHDSQLLNPYKYSVNDGLVITILRKGVVNRKTQTYLLHLNMKNNNRVNTCAKSRAVWKYLFRKMSSGISLQFTVHT